MESWYQERFYKKVDKFQSFDHAYVSVLLLSFTGNSK
jgi:hypothetical protein